MSTFPNTPSPSLNKWLTAWPPIPYIADLETNDGRREKFHTAIVRYGSDRSSYYPNKKHITQIFNGLRSQIRREILALGFNAKIHDVIRAQTQQSRAEVWIGGGNEGLDSAYANTVLDWLKGVELSCGARNIELGVIQNATWDDVGYYGFKFAN